MNLPTQGGAQVLDCFFHREGRTDFSSLAEAHQRILDQVVEINEQVMDTYLDTGEGSLTPQQLHDAFEQCLREGHLVPICFVSARTGAGVARTAGAGRAPAAASRARPIRRHSWTARTSRWRSVPIPTRHVVADVFKIINDPFVGKLGVFRVWQGTIRRDSQLFIDDGRKPFKVGHLFRLDGKGHVEIEQAVPGDIAAVAKVEEIHFDAVLHDAHEEELIHLAPLAFPQPMFGLALEPQHKGQEQKLSQALCRLAEEDPCFKVEHRARAQRDGGARPVRTASEGDARAHEGALRRGSDHASAAHRLPRDHRRRAPRATTGTRSRPAAPASSARSTLRVEPLARGDGFEFVDAVKGGVIPGQFMPAIEKGVRQAMEHGAIAGFPLQDLRVTVLDGKHHSVDSKEVAFISAGRKAFLDAVAKAQTAGARADRRRRGGDSRNTTWATSPAGWPASARRSSAPTCSAAAS